MALLARQRQQCQAASYHEDTKGVGVSQNMTAPGHWQATGAVA